jgi:hypothetical protein
MINSFRVRLTAAGFLAFAFFIAYGVMSIPGGFLVERFTEKPAMVLAFLAGTWGSLSSTQSLLGFRSFCSRDCAHFIRFQVSLASAHRRRTHKLIGHVPDLDTPTAASSKTFQQMFRNPIKLPLPRTMTSEANISLFPVAMLEKLGFQNLVAETLTVRRIPRVMTIYQFVQGMVLALYVGFARLQHIRFVACQRVVQRAGATVSKTVLGRHSYFHKKFL